MPFGLVRSPLPISFAIEVSCLKSFVRLLLKIEPSVKPMTIAIKKLIGCFIHSTTLMDSTILGANAATTTTMKNATINLFPI